MTQFEHRKISKWRFVYVQFFYDWNMYKFMLVWSTIRSFLRTTYNSIYSLTLSSAHTIIYGRRKITVSQDHSVDPVFK